MGVCIVIRPQDDAAAQQASDWCDAVVSELSAHGHTVVEDVDAWTPADATNIEAALRAEAELVCYFGHGARDAWHTDDQPTIDRTNVKAAKGKAVVSIACLTGRELGPDAITSGVVAWLGFTIKMPVLTPHKNTDPFGEATINGLSTLATGANMGEVRDSLVAQYEQLAEDFDIGGRFRGHPAHGIGYYGAHAIRDHLTLEGEAAHQPLP